MIERRSTLLRAIRGLVLASAIVSSTTIIGGSDTPAAAPPCFSPESTAFDFTIGVWRGLEKRLKDGEWTPMATADVEVRKLPGGCSLLEVLTVSTEKFAFSAYIFRSYDGARKSWFYAFADNLGHFQIWNGKKEGDTWWFYRADPPPDRQTISRLAWRKIAGGVEEIGQQSEDGGKSWKTVTIIEHTLK